MKLRRLRCLALNARYSALKTYLWIVQTHPSPLPHQTLSLPPPQPDCRAPNKSTQKHRKRGKYKVRKGVQEPHQHNSKQVEHHLRHPGPRGTVNRDSAGFHCFCFHLISAYLWHLGTKFKSFPYDQWWTSLNMFFMFEERMVTITMATLLSAEHKLIFTTPHRAI